MQITIQLADEVSAAAEARVHAVAAATEQHDINFSGDTITVDRGDYTCLTAGEVHKDAQALFALVQAAIAPDYEFPRDYNDAEGAEYMRVPFAEGGFIRLPATA
jgi:hypothetical protein